MHQVARNRYMAHKRPFVRIGPVMDASMHTDALAICNHCCALRPTKLNDRANVFNSNKSGGAMYWHQLQQEVKDSVTLERLRRVQAFALDFAEFACGETLHPFSFSMWHAFILKYAGIKGSFGWHYDSEDEEDVRVLICVARTETCGSVEYIDEDQRVQRIDLECGQCYLLRGSQTYHRVLHNQREEDERLMLGFHFTRTPNKTTRNLCYFGTLTGWKLSGIGRVLRHQSRY